MLVKCKKRVEWPTKENFNFCNTNKIKLFNQWRSYSAPWSESNRCFPVLLEKVWFGRIYLIQLF